MRIVDTSAWIHQMRPKGDPAVRATNFDELRRTADDPEAARRYMRRAALLDSLQSAAAVT